MRPLLLRSFVAVALLSCSGTSRPRAHLATTTPARSPASSAPTEHWTNRAMQRVCEAEAARAASEPPPLTRRSVPRPLPRVELPPALARYPQLGASEAECQVFGNCLSPMPPAAYAPPPDGDGAFVPPLSRGLAVERHADIRLLTVGFDCTTSHALAQSIDADAVRRCIHATPRRCGIWSWMTPRVRVDHASGRVVALEGSPEIDRATAQCFLDANNANRWTPNESDAPVEVSFVIAWIWPC